MPGQGWNHLQLAGIGFVDAWSGSEASATCWNWSCRCLAGVGSICNLLELDLQMPGQGWKHLQLAGIGFADAWSGLEASATCWNWICRCLAGVGSICNLLELDMQIHIGVNSGRGSICNLLDMNLQMPGRGRKHLQLVGIGFADAWSGSESSATCWNWICRCLAGVRKHLQLAGIGFVDAYPGVGIICNMLELDLQMPGRGWKHLQLVGYEFADTYPGVGSICNLLELDLQMPGRGWKHLQLAGIGFVDAWPGLEASTTCWI